MNQAWWTSTHNSPDTAMDGIWRGPYHPFRAPLMTVSGVWWSGPLLSMASCWLAWRAVSGRSYLNEEAAEERDLLPVPCPGPREEPDSHPLFQCALGRKKFWMVNTVMDGPLGSLWWQCLVGGALRSPVDDGWSLVGWCDESGVMNHYTQFTRHCHGWKVEGPLSPL